jgi:hypothetical protein
MSVLRILAVSGNILLLILVFELVRRGRLKERYSLLWLLSSVVLLILSLQRRLLEIISERIGIFYPPSLLFLVAFVFLLLITLHFSAVISGLSEKNKKLAQELALLKHAVEELRQARPGDA